MSIQIGSVLESGSNGVLTKIEKEGFEDNKDSLMIGKYLKISVGNHNSLIASIVNIKASSEGENDKFFIMTEPLGMIADGKFTPGASELPSPTEPVYIASADDLSYIFAINQKYSFHLGRLVHNKDISLYLDGNTFFSKHIGIVGSTGSGKSCTVAKILQEATGISNGKNINSSIQKNSHIIIFDIHSEYKSAFTLPNNENFSLNYLDVEKIKLPYWLMNSEELESLFIESNENNSHNQVSQFKKAVIKNKEKHNPHLKNVTYDTPAYFNIKEVFNYISNLNDEVVSKLPADNKLPKIMLDATNSTILKDIDEYFEKIHTFAPTSTAKDDKASNGPFNGEFNRFLARLENKISDKRLDFIMNASKLDGTDYLTDDFSEILQQFLGYLNKSNITIVDLSGVPFEVLSITVSLISRLIFDFSFHYSKLKHGRDELNNVPFMLVCEEAHNYVPKTGGSEYNASKKSIERIAKEGRKYGLSLMVVSQRPSEVSDTIFAQCNNFVSLRLTNIADQNYIKNLLPNNSAGVADILPTLSPGQCLFVGDASPLPATVFLDLPNPLPKSENVQVHDEWLSEWKEINTNNEPITIENVVSRWHKE